MSHLLDHDIVSQRYFFPRREPLADPFVVAVDGAELHCYRRAPHDGAPTVLHFHGNGEVVADWASDFAPALIDAGVNVVLAEYRGYGGSTGRPQLVRMLDDAVAVADATGVAPERLVVYGRSVGSIYALHVAAERRVGALVIESGISDVLERLVLRLDPRELGTTAPELRAAVAEVCDHRAKIAAHAGPALILHARGDDLVPPVNAEELAAWAGERAALHLFGEGDHNTIHYYNGGEILALVIDLALGLG